MADNADMFLDIHVMKRCQSILWMDAKAYSSFWRSMEPWTLFKDMLFAVSPDFQTKNRLYAADQLASEIWRWLLSGLVET